MERIPEDVAINTAPRESYLATNENTPLQSDKVEDAGLKLIILTFTVISVIISIGLASSIYYGDKEVEPHGSVVSDSPICTLAGEEILRQGGNALDAAIAVTFCLGVVLPHLTGVGGNGVVLVYDQRSSEPLLCSSSWPLLVSSLRTAPVAVPGLVSLLSSAHLSHGQLPWSSLLEPALRTAREGFPVGESVGQSVSLLDPNTTLPLREWLSSLKVGTPVKSTILAKTLEAISQHKEQGLYSGSLSEWISPKMLDGYRPSSGDCSVASVLGYRLVASGEGTGGPFLLEILSKGNITHNTSLTDLIHIAQLYGDSSVMSWPFPGGVTVSVTDGNDLYATVVSGLGPVLGSQVLTQDGYILGTSLAPLRGTSLTTISTAFVGTETSSRCGKRIITGGSDARDVMQALRELLWAPQDSGPDPQASVEGPRVRLSSHSLLAEQDHAPSLLAVLPPASRPYPSINVIAKLADLQFPYADSRGRGLAVHF